MNKHAEQLLEKIASEAIELGYMAEMEEMEKDAAFGMNTAKSIIGKSRKYMGDLTGKTMSKATDTYNRAQAAADGAILSRTSKQQAADAAKLNKYTAMADHELASASAAKAGKIGAGIAGVAGAGAAMAALARKSASKGVKAVANQGLRKKLLIGGGAAAGVGGAYALAGRNREQ